MEPRAAAPVNAVGVLVLSVGSFGAGWIVGYALKKALSFVMTVGGLFTLGLLALQGLGVVTVNWQALTSLVSNAVAYLVGEYGPAALAVALSGAGLPFVVGLILGLMKGEGGGLSPFTLHDLERG